MFKVSIIVPIYNVEKYLSRCLESLVNQTLKEIQIILVNDGSKDNSINIAQKYAAMYNNIIYIEKENGGLSDARNFAIPYCKGEYIGFVDSDDYVEICMYQLMYDKAIQCNADIVTCDYYKTYSGYNKRIYSRQFSDNKDMLIGPKAAAWNKIYKTKMLRDSGVLFPKGFLYEDTAFWAMLVPYCKICSYVELPLVHYVQRKGSIINSSSEKVLQIFDIFTIILKYYKEKGLYTEYSDELEYYCSRIALGSNLERIAMFSNKVLRHSFVKKTYMEIITMFPEFTKNKYVKKDWKRYIAYRFVTYKNLKILVEILHYYIKTKNRKLINITDD